MRVPTISKYSTATYQLGVITSDLKDANDVMSTQKAINALSDNPIGVTQVLDLKESIKNLEQIETNVEMGRTWLTGIESSLSSVNDLILDLKTDALQYANGSVNPDNRKDAIDNIKNIMEQIVNLGNTQMNGNYIFSGSSTDVAPFEYYSDEDPPRVAYVGESTAFKIKSDKNTEIPVGRVGSEVFWEDTVSINSTNNTITFKEDPGHGSDYVRTVTATIPDGEYDNDTLATTISNELNRSSAEDGYGVTYKVEYDESSQRFSIVEDGSYSGYMSTEFLWDSGGATVENDPYIDSLTAGGTVVLDDIHSRVYDSEAIDPGDDAQTFKLTRAWDESSGNYYWGIENGSGVAIPATITATGVPVGSEVEVTYESNGGTLPYKVVGNADGIQMFFDDDDSSDVEITFDNSVSKGDYVQFTINPATEVELEDTSIGHEIGFVGENTISAPIASDIRVTTDISPPNAPLVINNTNNKIDFQEVTGTGENSTAHTLTASVKTKNYTSYDELAKEVEKSMEAESLKSGNGIDYSVSWDSTSQKFTIKENGTELDELNMLWQSGTNAPVNEGGTGQSIGSILGFDSSSDDSKSALESNQTVERGIFKTLSDLIGYLSNDDVDGIERTIGRLDSNYSYITSVIADTGMKYDRLETRKIVTSEMNLNLTERRSNIEDADIVEAIMNLTSIQSAYDAALKSTSQIMKTSLMDYM